MTGSLQLVIYIANIKWTLLSTKTTRHIRTKNRTTTKRLAVRQLYTIRLHAQNINKTHSTQKTTTTRNKRTSTVNFVYKTKKYEHKTQDGINYDSSKNERWFWRKSETHIIAIDAANTQRERDMPDWIIWKFNAIFIQLHQWKRQHTHTHTYKHVCEHLFLYARRLFFIQ